MHCFTLRLRGNRAHVPGWERGMPGSMIQIQAPRPRAPGSAWSAADVRTARLTRPFIRRVPCGQLSNVRRSVLDSVWDWAEPRCSGAGVYDRPPPLRSDQPLPRTRSDTAWIWLRASACGWVRPRPSVARARTR